MWEPDKAHTAEKMPEIIYEDFKDELLHKLNELRETNILCDTTARAQARTELSCS